MYKTEHGKLPWHDRQEWLFPKSDSRLYKSFTHGPNDVDDAILQIEAMCAKRRTCIQAGGALGIWPIRLSQFFDSVITLEPHPINYECLLHNTQDIETIEAIHAALGREPGQVNMCLDEHEKGNSGAYYVTPGDEIEQITIDGLDCANVDLIYLDIEGAETDALLGANKTIAKYRPVIGLEDKKNKFYRRFGYKRSPVEMLVKDFGYQEIARYHLDVILAPLDCL
jgi:FkbM family methyltransferase